MILQTETGQALPTAITLNAEKGELSLYAVDENGVPVECFFVLTPAGAHSNGGFIGGRNSSIWFGALDGFTSPTIVNTMTVGPAFSTKYYPPSMLLSDGVPIYTTLTAIPLSGGPARQIMITVHSTSKGIF